jgi:hypothetical protein
MRWRLSIMALALALGSGCSPRLRASGVFTDEPWVDVGSFRKVGGRDAWMFSSSSEWWKFDIPVWVTPETKVVLNGTQVGIGDVEPGQEVRLLYDMRPDGSSIARRIDVLGDPRPGAQFDTDS